MKTGILFDLDGTLLDTLEDLCDAVNHVLIQHGCPERSLEEIRRFVGNGAARLIRLSLPGNDTDPDHETVFADFRRYYDAHCRVKTRPYHGIPEALAVLQEKYPIAVVSNKPDSAVKPLCREYFGGIFARGEDADCPRKPAPDMVRQAMAAIGVDRCIYVGDSEVDVLTARNASVPCLAVTWGFRDEEELKNAGAAHFCHDPKDLPRCIQALMKETEEDIHGK